MFAPDLIKLATDLLDKCQQRGARLAVAESCTGGLISGLLTEVPGSSKVLDRGFVTYANDAKIAMLGIPGLLIENHGAVSSEVAGAMAKGALERSKANYSVAVTGIAGPDGATQGKQVGLVYVAAAQQQGPIKIEKYQFKGNRDAVRLASVEAALRLLQQVL
ncbi:MAG: nicotinamide-nucleotide amidohydrolase family protein [Alphaproteobacteria bacterium]|nr:nicotinamide-nucleotide amidohydrolase family protein [Alphaproteobacteria bacterium]